MRELLARAHRPRLAQVGDPREDATFDVSSGTARVVPAKTGRGVDDESWRQAWSMR